MLLFITKLIYDDTLTLLPLYRVAGVDELAVGGHTLDGDGVGSVVVIVGVEVECAFAVVAHSNAGIPIQRVALVGARLDATVAAIVAW